MFNQISFLKILTLFSLTFETLFLIDLCFLEDIEVKGVIQYISFSKVRETCFASLKNNRPIHELAVYLFILIYISFVGYFEIERKVKFQFFGENLEFEIVESK